MDMKSQVVSKLLRVLFPMLVLVVCGSMGGNKFTKPVKQQPTTLKEWMDSNNRKFDINFRVINRCCKEKRSSNNRIIEHEQFRKIKVGLKQTSSLHPSLIVFGDESPMESIGPPIILTENTHYLEYKDNMATFQRLPNRNIMWGNWFVTSKLSGCDVWIAYRQSDGFNEPLIIHVNANDYCKQNSIEKCLAHKQNMAFEARDYIRKNQELYYEFTTRVALHSQDRNYDWEEFTRKYSIQPCLYPGFALFYGTYDSLRGWDFELRDLKTGKKISCTSLNKSMPGHPQDQDRRKKHEL